MNLAAIPVRRPVATAMAFLGIVVLGMIGLERIPVELLPPLAGEDLYVRFARPGSEPEVVERELLLPLEARVTRLAGVDETWGEVRGPSGELRIRFERGVDLKVREIELRRLAGELAREQPPGTVVDVGAQDLSAVSRFVMIVQVTGPADTDALRDIVEERVRPRLGSVPGVSQVLVSGGASREITVRVDPDRAALLGVDPRAVAGTLAAAVRRERYLGAADDASGRTVVLLEGRPGGLASLGELRVGGRVPLREVSDISTGPGERESLFRVDGAPAVGLLVFKEEGANLVALGRALHARLDALREELGTYGLGFVVGFDGAGVVERELDRLKRLALSGFVVALAVLFVFLRQWRAVTVVAVAVPVSLLAALALLYLGGWSLNLITLFGLAVGIGMLVDNSIVVYEAVQRRLEHGADPDAAAEGGVRRTLRAIFAASATNAVVFLPIAMTRFEDATVQSLVELLAVAILLPLAGSLLVAVGLVPLLARRLAAPAALARLEALRARRRAFAGWRPPDRARELFSGVLKVALRRPGLWIGGVALAIVLTIVIALPGVAYGLASQEASRSDTVVLRVGLPPGGALESAADAFGTLERAALEQNGVEHVESYVREDGGTLTVHLADDTERAPDVDAATIRAAVRRASEEIRGVTVETENAGGGGGSSDRRGGAAAALGQGPSEIVLSGPEAPELMRLARSIRERLESIDEIPDDAVTISARDGLDELRVVPVASRLAAFGLTADELLPVLRVLRREGVDLRVGFVRADGREIPLTVRRERGGRRAAAELASLRVATPAGVLPLGAVADIRRMPPEITIQHHDGRREISVFYRLGASAPQTGPARAGLEARIREAVGGVRVPAGYVVETPDPEEGFAWFRRLLLPVVALLFALLAIVFESLTLPLLVLVALPLTVLGATWALALSGTPAGPMALAGALALVGLTVNPAILLIDRMQERVRGGATSAGAAALASVRERTRPVLMTAATTLAGLWPLAITTGRENELWPPFATVVMGGLATSAILTLVVVPIGFVVLRRLDVLFGRLGPWVLIGWAAVVTAVMAPLIRGGWIASTTWAIVTTVLVAALTLGAAAAIWRRPRPPEPDLAGERPAIETRFLTKIYGRPGPIGRAWRASERFRARVAAMGGRPFDPADARTRLVPIALLAVGLGWLASAVQGRIWALVFLFAVAATVSWLALEIRRARGLADAMGVPAPGGVERAVSAAAPWVALAAFAFLRMRVFRSPPGARGIVVLAAVALGVLVVQTGRRTALRLGRGELASRPDGGLLRRPRAVWRAACRRLFGFDLPSREVHALRALDLDVRRGMVGVLGPNGAGKTTLLRLVSGILDPSVGTVHVGGVRIGRVRRILARWIGYLPQDFGLPQDLTARDYLAYYALLYEIPRRERAERIGQLLREVGLADRADEPIGSYSGGMRQRVAVARTLLRLPPVIVVDEPTVGLDPRERIRFRNLLSRLAEGRVVLFSTHVVEDVEVACERVVVLSRGRLVFDGTPEGLARRAEGQVWEVRIAAGDVSALPEEARVVDEIPEGDDIARARVLCARMPLAGARPLPPSLEDGYLLLTGGPA